MNSLLAKDFFTLNQFPYPELWLENEFVWMALHHIDEFFQNFSFPSAIKEIPPHVVLDNPDQIFMGEGVILEPGVYVQGPCILGEGTIVRHGAYLRGNVICGKKCVIGHATEIKHSILFHGVQIAHLSYVGDSILGNRVNLGAGVKCANLRLDRREVTISFREEKHRTGLKKLGAIIGDGCQIGCNCVLNPGTILGKECAAYPLLSLHGVISERQRVQNVKGELTFSPLETAILEWLR